MNSKLARQIGYACRNRRKALRLNQVDVAELLEVSVEFYARIERGTSLPSITTFARICEKIQLDPRFALIPHLAQSHQDSESPVVEVDTDPLASKRRELIRNVNKASPALLRTLRSVVRLACSEGPHQVKKS